MGFYVKSLCGGLLPCGAREGAARPRAIPARSVKSSTSSAGFSTSRLFSFRTGRKGLRQPVQPGDAGRQALAGRAARPATACGLATQGNLRPKALIYPQNYEKKVRLLLFRQKLIGMCLNFSIFAAQMVGPSATEARKPGFQALLGGCCPTRMNPDTPFEFS